MENNYQKLQVPVTLSVEEINLVLKWLGAGPLHEVFPIYQKIQQQQVGAVQAHQLAVAGTSPLPPAGDGASSNGADQAAETVN